MAPLLTSVSGALRAGILQGCLMSGFLFAVVLDAPLGAMDTALSRGGYGASMCRRPRCGRSS